MGEPQLLNRLGRRGEIVVKASDGSYDVSFKAPGPYLGRAWCTTDEADFWSYCHLGATNWHGTGPDLDALVAECEESTRPPYTDVDELRWKIRWRRNTRTYGPPLPDYMRWNGWRPGNERWLRTSGHAFEYLGGYLRDMENERTFDAEQAASELRRQLPRVPRRSGVGGVS